MGTVADQIATARENGYAQAMDAAREEFVRVATEAAGARNPDEARVWRAAAAWCEDRASATRIALIAASTREFVADVRKTVEAARDQREQGNRCMEDGHVSAAGIAYGALGTLGILLAWANGVSRDWRLGLLALLIGCAITVGCLDYLSRNGVPDMWDVPDPGPERRNDDGHVPLILPAGGLFLAALLGMFGLWVALACWAVLIVVAVSPFLAAWLEARRWDNARDDADYEPFVFSPDAGGGF